MPLIRSADVTGPTHEHTLTPSAVAMLASLLLFAALLAGRAGCQGSPPLASPPASLSGGEEHAQLLCMGGGPANPPDSRAYSAISCIELRLPASESRVAGDMLQECTHAILDFLCADASCTRATADGRSVAPRPFAQSTCLRHTCAVVCAAPEEQEGSVVQVGLFCDKCRDAKLLDDTKPEAARFWGGGIFSFWSVLSGCWSLLCSLSPVFCKHGLPISPFPPPPPPPPPLVPLLPSPPPRTSPPPLPPGTSPSPPSPASVKCGASSPTSCLGVPCAGTASCTTSTPQCCCASDCIKFGDCCADRDSCCLTREAAQARGHSSSRSALCGFPPPGQSCQNIGCSGTKTCNLAQRAGAALLQSEAPSGCCCDELCELMDDCCADKADCCGTSTYEPRRGQPVLGRTETAAFSTERVTPQGINVARGVNTRTGVGLLMPQHDGTPRKVSFNPDGASSRAAWAPVVAPAPAEGDVPEQDT